jgi:hypothetical protein
MARRFGTPTSTIGMLNAEREPVQHSASNKSLFEPPPNRSRATTPIQVAIRIEELVGTA